MTGAFLKHIQLFKKIPTTAFISTMLRVSYMILVLIAVKLTFNVYTSQEFIEFNYVLFLVGISSFIYYPFTIDLWQKNIKNHSIGIGLAVFLCLFFILGSVILFFVKSFQLSFWIIFGTMCYGVAKYFERINYVARLTDHQYVTAYLLTFVFLALEYAGLLLIYLLDWSVAVRLFLPGLVIIYVIKRFFLRGLVSDAQNTCTSFRQYFGRKNIFLVIYMGFFSVTIVCDRAIAYSEQGNLAVILLVFSFTTSILTLFTVIIDTFRPQIIETFNNKERLCALWRQTIIVLALFYLVSVTLGYFIAVKLSLIPDGMFIYWGSFLTVNLLISLSHLFQITRQSQKEMKLINIAWGITLLLKIGLFSLYKTIGLSYLSFVQSLVCVFCITLGMNYYYECKFLAQKYGNSGKSA